MHVMEESQQTASAQGTSSLAEVPDVLKESHDTPSKRLQFSLGSMLMIVTIACLATALVILSGRLNIAERQLESLQPISIQEVADQFEKSTTFAQMSTEVTDVRYSPTEDAYKVKFSFVNRDDPQKRNWSTSVTLKSNGYGEYYGRILSGPFCEALGYKNGFSVSVRTPSAL